EELARWGRRLAHWRESWRLARARRRERKDKERARRRVVVKHLQRAAEEKQKRLDRMVAPPRLDDEPGAPPPARPRATPGELDLRLEPTPPASRPVAVRRVTAAPPAVPQRRRPQEEFGFVEEAADRPAQLPPLSLLQAQEERTAV